MKILLASTGAVIVLLLASCGQHNSADYGTAGMEKEQKNFNYQLTDSTAAGNNDQQQAPGGGNATNADWDKKIIRRAALSLEVADYNRYYAALKEVVKSTGGYIATEDQNQTEYKLENMVTIKVPVEQFEPAMNLLAAGTGKEKVLIRKVASQDVTGEVVDTKSRMEAKRQVRLRYMELLQQAKTMEDIIKVQKEINDVQEQIEMGTGRVSYLNHAAALSTIDLTFYQVLNPSAVSPGDPSFLTQTWKAFERGWDFIKSLIIGLITIWPLWLIIFAVWFTIKRVKLPGIRL